MIEEVSDGGDGGKRWVVAVDLVDESGGGWL